MAILFSNEILDSVKRELQSATSSVQIITAYCKESSFSMLNTYINQDVKDKRLLIRFRMDDILQGSTDFKVVESGLKSGWKIFIRFDLHAKTYIIDNKRGVVGSANATNYGLGIGKSGNMEMATLINVEPHDVKKINKLFNDAIAMNKGLLDRMRKQIETVKHLEMKEHFRWDESITSLFTPHIDTLFSYELPEDFTLSMGEYFSFVDEIFSGNVKEFREIIRWSNSYLWLMDILKENNGCLYFGALAEKLHNALVSDPKPYRKDVKVMLANLLKLIDELEMDEIVIDRPNYSQRIRLRNSIFNS